jgi:hypothetical protein
MTLPVKPATDDTTFSVLSDAVDVDVKANVVPVTCSSPRQQATLLSIDTTSARQLALAHRQGARNG